jgi:hypothetical protein
VLGAKHWRQFENIAANHIGLAKYGGLMQLIRKLTLAKV